MIEGPMLLVSTSVRMVSGLYMYPDEHYAKFKGLVLNEHSLDSDSSACRSTAVGIRVGRVHGISLVTQEDHGHQKRSISSSPNRAMPSAKGHQQSPSHDICVRVQINHVQCPWHYLFRKGRVFPRRIVLPDSEGSSTDVRHTTQVLGSGTKLTFTRQTQTGRARDSTHCRNLQPFHLAPIECIFQGSTYTPNRTRRRH